MAWNSACAVPWRSKGRQVRTGLAVSSGQSAPADAVVAESARLLRDQYACGSALEGMLLCTLLLAML
jgi:hypothetical protein